MLFPILFLAIYVFQISLCYRGGAERFVLYSSPKTLLIFLDLNLEINTYQILNLYFFFLFYHWKPIRCRGVKIKGVIQCYSNCVKGCLKTFFLYFVGGGLYAFCHSSQGGSYVFCHSWGKELLILEQCLYSVSSSPM